MSEHVQVLFAGETGAATALRARLAPLPVRVFDAADRDPAALCVLLVPPGDAMPGRILTLRAQAPGVPILVILRAADAAHLRALLDAGIEAVVSEDAAAATLRETIAALIEARAAALPRYEGGVRNDVEALTPREAEVLRLLSAGFSNKEVARRLAVSVRTVETHRLNLRRKTQTGRLRDLVQLARRLGLQPVIEGGGDGRGSVRGLPIGAREVGSRCA